MTDQWSAIDSRASAGSGWRRSIGLLVSLLIVLALASPARAQLPGFGTPDDQEQFFDSRDQVTVTMKAGKSVVPRGGDLPIVIVMDHNPTWHSWTNEQADLTGYATFEYAVYTQVLLCDGTYVGEDEDPCGGIDAATGITIHEGFIEWPAMHKTTADVGDGPQDYGVYEGRARIYIPAVVAEDAPIGSTTVAIALKFQSCDATQCLAPVTMTLTTDIEIIDVGQAGVAVTDEDLAGFPTDVFGRIRAGEKAPEVVKFDLFGIISFDLNVNGPGGLLLLGLVAAIGGFLLNLTPCVLPVIPIKIMGLSQAAHGSRRRTLMLGVALFAGVVTFWMALGIPIAFVKSFTATNQLFQMPIFTIAVGVFIVLMAIGMCGLFAIRLPQSVYLINPNHESLHGSFVFGIMAGVLSTPCTAPFMGAAVAWASTQATPIVLSVFAAVGIGMGVPYLVLAAFPALVEKMPRTGPASELIKQVMGLLMLAAGAYFLGVGLSGWLVTPPDPPSRLYWWVVAAFGVAAGGWLAYKTFRISNRGANRVVFGGIGALIFAISAYIGVRMTDKGPIDWIYYTPERFADAKASGNVVVMEFTAEWCLNCKALEESVLRSARVTSLLNGDGVTPLKVDLTGNNVDGNAMLADVNRLTIPLLVVFAPDGTETFKGDYYTPEQVIDAVATAKPGLKVAGGSDGSADRSANAGSDVDG